MALPIDPGVVTLVERTFIDHINLAMGTIASYAFNLLYFFTVLELVFLGFVWALQRDLGVEKIFLKLTKIGLIFFIIRNYRYLISIILNSFTKLSGVVINNAEVVQYISNPGNIWQYGHDIGINLLQMAAKSELVGLAMIQVFLGGGILLTFGLLGIQLVIQIVGFYFVSLGALIMLPFGAFNPSKKMFDRAAQAVLQAGLRLMVLTSIIGVAAITWDQFDFINMETGDNFNINQPLGLFFTTLLFLGLAYYLPKILTQTVGEIGGGFLDDGSISRSSTVSYQETSFTQTSPGVSDTSVAAAIPSEQVGGYGESAIASATTISTTSTGAPSFGGTNIEGKVGLAGASKLTESISDATAQKIKNDLLKTINDKNTST